MFGADIVARRLRVRGLVQGVGFRPFVHRLACACRLAGWACNDGEGVLIHLEGSPAAMARFQNGLPAQAPRSAHIDSVACAVAVCEGRADFRIIAAQSAPLSVLARVPPDRALCADCRRELCDPGDRRCGHPFITCTECGPRYSILESLPYERCVTTMNAFGLCPRCGDEYGDPLRRRFHAETIACLECGPTLSFIGSAGERNEGARAVAAAANVLRIGQIVALKGLGGFQLLARADDDRAVRRLRERKRRPSRPLAVMAPSIDFVRRQFRVSAAERDILTGPENPIVLLECLPESAGHWSQEVAPRLRHVGVMLPTTPLHLLLLGGADCAVVATSGNREGEPILTDEADIDRLRSSADAFLIHDRPIRRRIDDSVARVIDDRPVLLRLARGYAPLPLPSVERLAGKKRCVLATGGHQKGALALWTGSQAVLSPHVGDLDAPETRRAFADLAADLGRLYRCEPEVIACDLHPDYFTSAWARATGKPVVSVQHHHAHAAACMAEHSLLDRTVLAVTWDGTGFGTDGTVWGGEILRAGADRFEPVASLRLLPLPGGEAAIRQPARAALGVLAQAFGDGEIPCSMMRRIGISPAHGRPLLQMIRRGVNTPWTSSVGRLFDAVAALLLGAGQVSYEGEAAAWLEAVVEPGIADAYPLPTVRDPTGLPRGDWRPLVRALVADIEGAVDVGVCAGRFHNALAAWAAEVIATQPDDDVVLGGGCFQNAVLTSRMAAAIEARGRKVHRPGLIPPGDGGLAVGQLAVALASL